MENMKTAVDAYKSAQVDAAVLGASPYELVAMLFAKAIEFTNEAKTHMLNGDINAKGHAIKLAAAIITDGLRGSLNMEEGGEIAQNLDVLYEYMTTQLVKAHAENNTEILDEVVTLLSNVKGGWDGIKPEQPVQSEAQPQP